MHQITTHTRTESHAGKTLHELPFDTNTHGSELHEVKKEILFQHLGISKKAFAKMILHV